MEVFQSAQLQAILRPFLPQIQGVYITQAQPVYNCALSPIKDGLLLCGLLQEAGKLFQLWQLELHPACCLFTLEE